MTEQIVEPAPAKVNLALHVTGRRADGYHLLDTLVVFAEAGDRITATPAAGDGFVVTGPFSASLSGEDDNLVLKARDLLRELTGQKAPVAISLEKNLPVASGVGGGSSDAAATLRTLVRLWNANLSPASLAKGALRLGADLAMCLEARTLMARGIGDALEVLPGLPPLAMVLVNPGLGVPTPAVFRALETHDNPPLPAFPPFPNLSMLLGWLERTRNDLETPALAIEPRIGDALASLHAGGAAFARMSGSGATCFGIFATEADAARAAAAIAAAEPSWYVKATRTIEKAETDVAH